MHHVLASDQAGDFATKCNTEMVGLVPVSEPSEVDWLKGIIAKHLSLTGSGKARDLLDQWATALPKFVKVFPHDYRRVLEEEAAEQVRREQASLKFRRPPQHRLSQLFPAQSARKFLLESFSPET